MNPRQTLRTIHFPYIKLPWLGTSLDEGYYWDEPNQRVVAMKRYGDILNPIAFITKEALDERGLEGFIDWESKLWTMPGI